MQKLTGTDGCGWLAGWLMYLPPAKATLTQFCLKIWLISPRIWPAETSWISGRLLAGSWLATGWVASWLAGWLADVPPPSKSLSGAILPKDFASFTKDLASRQILDFWLAAGC